ncbi:hypothetical protein FRC12_023778 [Ceratobasidium sp. 428]|nr:hypothetical protein FRC12_023778 [Ceratobasidium sp. 428]
MYQSINIHPQLSVNTAHVKIAENIWEIYDFIVHNYSAGDQVYLFGISQGAFVARKVASLLGGLGILPGEEMELFFRHWHTSNQSHTSQPEQKIEIEFLGLWDSAGLDHLWYGTQELVDPLGVENNSLPDHVKRVRHVMAYHERSGQLSTYTSVQSGGNDQRVAQVWFPGTRRDVGEIHFSSQLKYWLPNKLQGEIQDAGVELDMTYLNAVISQAAGTGLEVHNASLQEEWDSEKATKLWEIEGRGEQLRTSMSNTSTYCHRSMWAPLARLFPPHPTGPHDGYCPAYWARSVPLTMLNKPRKLNALERHLWAGRWENTIPDPENCKDSEQTLGRGIQKTGRPLQREPVNIESEYHKHC